MRSTLIFCLLLPLSLPAQERSEPRGPQTAALGIAYEAVSLFGPDSTKATIAIHYRIQRNFFVFVRSNDPSAPRNEFVARGQLLTELFDEKDVSVARAIRPIALNHTGLPGADEAQEDLEGAIPFSLPAGKYRIVFEVDDLESGRTFVDKKRTVEARSVNRQSLDLSAPFFVSVDSAKVDTPFYRPFNHGSNVLYGSVRGGLVSQVWCPQRDSVLRIHWALRGQTDNRSEQPVDHSGDQFSVAEGLLSLATKEGSVAYGVSKTDPAWRVLYVPIPLQILEPGIYRLLLNVTAGQEHFKDELTFHVVWPNRPRSLMDWDIATDALRYIAPVEEMDKILSVSSDQGLLEFRRFWRQRDPDTTTAYNEIMVEFYRRVDEAQRRFSTVKEQDGYKTDRGRIYILNGPPTKIERSVLPGQPSREIWTYENPAIRKQFVFTERNKSGNYILTQTINL